MAILLLAACGVKKTAVPAEADKASEPIHSPITDSLAQAGTAVDSLAFLGDLVNDSSIHINWVHGIPFIIDDSVPMLLPPIDKNPQGYVSSREYQANERHIYGTVVPTERVIYPIDSLPWLNKCLNELSSFLMHPSNNIPLQHNYNYRISLLKAEKENFVEIRAFQTEIAGCMPSILMQQSICYYFDFEGNLIGKCYIFIPHCFIGKYPLRKRIPNFNLFYAQLTNKLRMHQLIILHYSVEDPNGSPCNYDQI